MLERHVIEVAGPFLHLPPDAVRLAVADVPSHRISESGRDYLLAFLHEEICGILRPRPVAFEILLQIAVFQWIKEFEGQVLQLRLHFVETEAACQRGEEELGLRSDLPLLLGLHRVQCPHIVQAVRQLEYQYPYIVLNGAENVLEVVHLVLVPLGHRIHEECHVRSETRADFLNCVVSVLDHVVKQGGADNARVPLPHLPHDYHGDCKRVKDVGESAFPFLRPVRLLGQFISVFYQSACFLIVGVELGE